VNLRTGLKAQLKAVLAKHGLRPPVNNLWYVTGPKWLDALELPEPYLHRIRSLRDLVDAYELAIDQLERRIYTALKDDPGYRAIQVIDGVGPILGAIFVAEIGDVSRFCSADALCSWAGLTPKHRESDAKVRRGRITKAGSRLVRWAAIEAASKNHAGGDFKEAYRRIADRRGAKIAHVARLARSSPSSTTA
jgi:transposase